MFIFVHGLGYLCYTISIRIYLLFVCLFRNVRFEITGLKKQVNTKWAIDLINEVPAKKVTSPIVSQIAFYNYEIYKK